MSLDPRAFGDDLKVPEPIRCWQTTDAAYNAYHDDEWGRPVVDERGIYERLVLEGFQSGLSWLTILRKRANFRAAFARFDPDEVARFDDSDVERLLNDAGIVRHRGKIEAAIANAQATVALRGNTPLHALVWEYRRDDPPAAEWEAQTPASTKLSKRLRAAGFKFVGPTTVYSTMQACGIVNDHRADCHVRAAVERERQRVGDGSRSLVEGSTPRTRPL
jgi:DNA-3-methyladenine glycosylase I